MILARLALTAQAHRLRITLAHPQTRRQHTIPSRPLHLARRPQARAGLTPDYGYSVESSPSNAPTPKAQILDSGTNTLGLAHPIMLNPPPTIPLPPAPGDSTYQTPHFTVTEIKPSTPKRAKQIDLPATPRTKINLTAGPITPPKAVRASESEGGLVIESKSATAMIAGVAPPATRPPAKFDDSPKAEDCHLRPVGEPTVIRARPARKWTPVLCQMSKAVAAGEKSLRVLAQDMEISVNGYVLRVAYPPPQYALMSLSMGWERLLINVGGFGG